MTSTYRGMDRAALDLAYNNVRVEPGYQHRMLGFKEQSDALYRRVSARLDIPYGDQPRQHFDWLSCGRTGAPTFVFIHGGYWQNYTKEDLAFVANGPLTRGFNVILAEYTLAPEATMTEIVGEVGQLLDYLESESSEIGFRGKISLSMRPFRRRAAGSFMAVIRLSRSLLRSADCSTLSPSLFPG